MNFKTIILIATFSVKTVLCKAQVTTQVHSQNNEANSYYIKALTI